LFTRQAFFVLKSIFFVFPRTKKGLLSPYSSSQITPITSDNHSFILLSLQTIKYTEEFLMLNLLWPIIIVVAANTLYNICAKFTPGEIQPMASLAISYFIAGLVSIILFFITSDSKNLAAELHKTNWATLALGIAIVGLEFGYIYVYRVGWNISTGSLVANISLACILLFLGVFVYKESISLQQILGIALCLLGMTLITK